MTGFIIRIAIATLSLGFNVWLFATGHWGWGISFLLITAIIILSPSKNQMRMAQMMGGRKKTPKMR